MANPRLPGIPENQQALLYAKLNEYNRGRASFKDAGVYLVVLPRPGGFTHRYPKDCLFSTCEICRPMSTNRCA